MRWKKSQQLLLLLLAVLLTSLTGITLARYITTVAVPDTVTLSIIPTRVVEPTTPTVPGMGEGSTVTQEGNNITFEGTSVALQYEKLNIALNNLETGHWYQLSFHVQYARMSFEGKTLDRPFGCTVLPNQVTDTSSAGQVTQMSYPDAFFWKSVNTSEDTDVNVSFYASSDTMYWVWELCGIQDGTTTQINLTNVTVVQDEDLDVVYAGNHGAAHVDFEEASFNFVNVSSTLSNQDYKANTDGTLSTTPLQDIVLKRGTYPTRITSDSMLFSLHAKYGYHEQLYVPLNNLTVGETYTLSFTANTPNTQWNTGEKYYGSWVSASKYNSNSSYFQGNPTNRYPYQTFEKQSGVQSASITFEATSQTMYWCWDLSAVSDTVSGTNATDYAGDTNWTWIDITDVQLLSSASASSYVQRASGATVTETPAQMETADPLQTTTEDPLSDPVEDAVSDPLSDPQKTQTDVPTSDPLDTSDPLADPLG